MKKYLVLFALLLSFLAFTAFASDSFDNTSLSIGYSDGEIVISGSFDNTDNVSGTYHIIAASYDQSGVLKDVKVSSRPIRSGTNGFIMGADIIMTEQNVKVFVLTDKMTPICDVAKRTFRSLRVFAIGNSFSVDAMQWLYGIAKDAGYDHVVLGNAYIGGCSLSTHRNNANSGNAAYIYYKNITGTWTAAENKSLLYCLKDEDWDLITLQQASTYSGQPSTYEPYLSELIRYVNHNKTNPNARIAWHMTWAYAADCTQSGFANYGNDQFTMYNAIVSAVQQKVLTNDGISFVIPSGTAIQNARTSVIGDTLNRDGYHLDLQLGRYIAGLTWLHAISGKPIDEITYVPSTTAIPEYYLRIAKESVKNAVAHPYEITQSVNTKEYSPEMDYDLENYDLIDWEPLGSTYYICTYGTTRYNADNAPYNNTQYFISSKIFSKSELPNGTLIVADTGYKYRPEGWESLDKAASKRASETSEAVTVVDDAWWGTYNYRAFNISTSNNSNIANKTAEVIPHFRIYVPKG